MLGLSLLKYNSRMAQTTEWLPAIRNCMKKAKSKTSTVPPSLPKASEPVITEGETIYMLPS